jgi:hypothetical protein
MPVAAFRGVPGGFAGGLSVVAKRGKRHASSCETMRDRRLVGRGVRGVGGAGLGGVGVIAIVFVSVPLVMLGLASIF